MSEPITVRLSDVKTLPENDRQILRGYVTGGGINNGILERLAIGTNQNLDESWLPLQATLNSSGYLEDPDGQVASSVLRIPASFVCEKVKE